jgi:hypothetical protein
MLVLRLTPPGLMAEFRAVAARASQNPGSRIAATLIVSVWVLAAVAAALPIWRAIAG